MSENRLYSVAATGLTAYCSDIITDTEEDEAYFMSVTGYQATVKGIIANFLEYYGISLSMNWQEHYYSRSSESYKVLLKKLPSGLVHSIVLPRLALSNQEESHENKFYIFTREGKQQTLSVFFKHLDQKTDIPLHPSWTGWLWKAFIEQEWLIELKTVIGSFKGYLVEWNQTELHDIISDALRNKIPEITQCMKGGV